MKFQTLLLTFFGVMAVIGLITFSKSDVKGGGGDPKVAGAQGNVVIWGTFADTEGLEKMIAHFNAKYIDSFSVSYSFHDPSTFDTDIVEALASGKGPDVLLIPDDLVLRHSDKIEMIPYTSVPQSAFTSLFVQAADIYMRNDGLVALPFAIDPMVMYWNRDIFTNASLTLPPVYWDEFLTLVPKLTKRDPKTSDLMQSTIAFGEYSNVDHAKDVLSMLFLQVGNPIVKYVGLSPESMLATRGSGVNAYVPDQDVTSAFRFFMDFSNPVKSTYTWSRAKSGSLNEFIDGNLAVHFDFASQYKNIQKKNPHLNFAISMVPLPRGTKAEVTIAKVHGLAVMKSSRNKATALIAVQRLLMDPEPAKEFAAAYDLPPVRRDMLAQKPTDAAMSVVYDAAIRAHTWLDPRPEVSNKAFQTMVESVSSGRNPVDNAVVDLSAALTSALLPYRRD